VPFVALPGTSEAEAIDAARSFGAWIVEELAVPVFFYGAAGEQRRTLPEVRRGAFRDLRPDLGPSRPDTRLGATVVGVRPVLVAINCELEVDDVELARRIAGSIRERDGGLPGVRALGLRLASRDRAQVSMNLVDLGRCGVQTACEEVRERARASGATIERVELVGLLPRSELARCSDEFLSWSGLRPDQTIEARLGADASGAEGESDADPSA